jgi:aerobic carbon-monoxide dehydrogenase small subunit
MTERRPSDALHDPTTPDGSHSEDYPAPDSGSGVLAALESYQLTVNGREREVSDAWLGESLLYVLRERLGLPGAKNACEQGECGSCSVLLDGRLVASCCVLAADAVGSQVTTVEGLSGEGELSDVQRAFVEEGAVQCGFCTPGLIVAIHHLLNRNPRATELELREAISGDLCRCTGYGRIFAAVRRVQQERAHARA